MSGSRTPTTLPAGLEKSKHAERLDIRRERQKRKKQHKKERLQRIQEIQEDESLQKIFRAERAANRNKAALNSDIPNERYNDRYTEELIWPLPHAKENFPAKVSLPTKEKFPAKVSLHPVEEKPLPAVPKFNKILYGFLLCLFIIPGLLYQKYYDRQCRKYTEKLKSSLAKPHQRKPKAIPPSTPVTGPLGREDEREQEREQDPMANSGLDNKHTSNTSSSHFSAEKIAHMLKKSSYRPDRLKLPLPVNSLRTRGSWPSQSPSRSPQSPPPSPFSRTNSLDAPDDLLSPESAITPTFSSRTFRG